MLGGDHATTYSAKKILTREAYSDLVQSCHEAVLQTIVFRIFAPSLPLRLKYSGSNNAEDSFSDAGGYSDMHGQRNYGVLDYLNHVDREYVMCVLQAAGVTRGRSQHRKQEWDRRYHEPKTSPEQLDQLLKLHPDEVKKCKSWNAGAKDASHFAEKLGLRKNVPLAAWTDPWAYMKEKLHVDEVTKKKKKRKKESTDVCPDDHSPPVDLIHSSLDVRVTIIQLIWRKIDPQDLDPDLPNNIRKNHVEPFLFETPVDLTAGIELLRQAVLPAATPDNNELKPSRFVTMPGTDTQISKEQLVHMIVQECIRDGRADGTKLSKDRVSRIKATAARVKAEEQRRDEPAIAGDRAHLQDDLAFCFVHSNGSKKLWFGKLQQMRSKSRSENT